jgi:PAS domain S-box-containing protein
MKKEQVLPKILKNKYIPTTEFYSQIIDSLQDYSIFTLDTDLIINSWSSGSIQIFQYETEEVIGKHFDIIFTEEDKKLGVLNTEIETAIKEGRATDNRWHICKDGSKFYASGLVFPLTGLEGEMLGFVKILRDLTDIRNSEEAIKRHIKELEILITHKESILAILSHDLRSPLAAIIGMTEYLKSNFDEMESSQIKEMIDLLNTSSKEELNMLDYLLEWARIKYASEAFTPTKIKLSQYVEKVFELLNEVAAIKSIHLLNEIEKGESVFADKKMLLSVLQNIISNAIKHSHEEGKITVTAKRKEDKLIIEIKDTGVGMSKEMQKKLFTPQMDSLSKERQDNKGAGIGLLLAKGFLEKNGGTIWVESVEGVGSSFYFTLPINASTDELTA